MPTYTYKCPQHGEFEEFLRLSEHVKAYACPTCSEPSLQVIHAVGVASIMRPYQCPITGKTINNVREHKRNLAEHACRLLEPGESADAARRATHHDDILDSVLDASIEQTIHAMPEPQKAQLFAEVALNPNIDADLIVRK